MLSGPMVALAMVGEEMRASESSLGVPGESAKTFTDEIAAGEWVRHEGVLRKVAAVCPRLGACEVVLDFEPLDEHVASVQLVAFERIAVWREAVVHPDVADAAVSAAGTGDPDDRKRARPELVRMLTERIEAGDLVRHRGRLRRVLAVYVREHWPEVSLDFDRVEGAEDRVHLRTGVYVSVWRMGGAA